MDITPRPPIVFVAGQGSWLTDSEGRRYLDFIQGWAVNCAGPFAAADHRGAGAAGGATDQLQPRFLQRSDDPAVAICWRGTAGCTRCSSPTAAPRPTRARSSWRANGARKYRDGAYEIITMDHGFHGRTLATMAASGKAQWEQLYEPKVSGFVKVPLNDLAAVEAPSRRGPSR